VRRKFLILLGDQSHLWTGAARRTILRQCRKCRSCRRDKSNPLFSAWQPARRTMAPSRHSGNKTSSNHDPSPSCKPPSVRSRARPLGPIYESLYKCNETVTGGASSITPPTLPPSSSVPSHSPASLFPTVVFRAAHTSTCYIDILEHRTGPSAVIPWLNIGLRALRVTAICSIALRSCAPRRAVSSSVKRVLQPGLTGVRPLE